MKRTILLFLSINFMMLIYGQNNLPYKPLSDFGTDTTAFLIYNFIDRAEQYNGKTVEDVYNDIKMLPIKDIRFNYKYPSGLIGSLTIVIDAKRKLKEPEIPIKSTSSIYLTFQTFTNLSEHSIDLRASAKEVYNYWKNTLISKAELIVPLESKYTDPAELEERKRNPPPEIEIRPSTVPPETRGTTSTPEERKKMEEIARMMEEFDRISDEGSRKLEEERERKRQETIRQNQGQ